MLHFARFRPVAIAAIVLALTPAAPTFANNYGESLAWQFMTPSDLAAQVALRDMLERKRGGGYAAPSYTTNIDRQYNCTVAATATGNSGSQQAVANSPAVTGASATSTGNAGSNSSDGRSGSGISNSQSNAGTVGSLVNGGTTTTVNGTAWQALNSDQSNSGNQEASIRNASACAFGMLN